jgi:hypothetical protein
MKKTFSLCVFTFTVGCGIRSKRNNCRCESGRPESDFKLPSHFVDDQRNAPDDKVR